MILFYPKSRFLSFTIEDVKYAQKIIDYINQNNKIFFIESFNSIDFNIKKITPHKKFNIYILDDKFMNVLFGKIKNKKQVNIKDEKINKINKLNKYKIILIDKIYQIYNSNDYKELINNGNYIQKYNRQKEIMDYIKEFYPLCKNIEYRLNNTELSRLSRELKNIYKKESNYAFEIEINENRILEIKKQLQDEYNMDLTKIEKLYSFENKLHKGFLKMIDDTFLKFYNENRKTTILEFCELQLKYNNDDDFGSFI